MAKIASLPTLTLILAAIRVLAAALGLGVQIWLVRAYGTTAFGYFSYFVTAVALLSLFAQGGVDTWMLRSVASLHGRGISWMVLRAALWRHLRLGLIASGLTGVAFGLATPWLPESGKIVPIGWFFVTSVALMAFRVLVGATRGLRLALVADSAEQLLRNVAMLLIAWCLLQLQLSADGGAREHAANLVVVYWLSFVTSGLWLLLRLRSSCVPGATGVATIEPYNWRVHLSFTGTALLGYAFFQLDTLWLGHYVTLPELGAYNMACNLVRLVIFFPMIVVSVLQPRLAAALATHNAEHVQRLVYAALSTSAVAAIASALLLGLSGDWVLATINPEYTVASTSLRWLIAVHTINAVLMVWGACLAVSHRFSDTLWAQIPGALVTVALYAWAIPRWGMPAAPVAVLAGMLVCVLVYAWMASKRGGISHALLLPPS